MGPYFQQAFMFLINTIFMFCMLPVFLRLILQKIGADFYNPLSQLCIKLTDPLVKPLRKLFPGFYGFDLAIVALLILLEVLKLIISCFVLLAWPNIGGLLIWAAGDLIGFIIQFYFFVIIIQAVFSWINQRNYSALSIILYKITEPLMRPIRRILPPISGIDLSPIPVMMVLGVLHILVATPLTNYGLYMALS
ncbi:MAG: YggT family protein [Legionellales bacterium]|nr:YggT family protein [Legionellales bacterium]